jgi:hypothetical protein
MPGVSTRRDTQRSVVSTTHPLRSSYGAGTATRLRGTICGWNEKTSRLRGSTSTFNHCTSLLPF